MLDQKLSPIQDPVWTLLARWAHQAGITPNQITLAGLVLSVFNAGLFLVHENVLLLGIFFLLIEAGDAVDGALARLSENSTPFGSFFDAATDRYKDALILVAIPVVYPSLWPWSMAALTGAFFTSYLKARAQAECDATNTEWPDFFERFERILLLSFTLILEGALTPVWVAPGKILTIGLAVLAVGAHATAVQRFFRAKNLLKRVDGVHR